MQRKPGAGNRRRDKQNVRFVFGFFFSRFRRIFRASNNLFLSR